MKKNLTKKLVLKKNTMINLDHEAQEKVVGGVYTKGIPCYTKDGGANCPLPTRNVDYTCGANYICMANRTNYYC
jgi:hypothetical protein